MEEKTGFHRWYDRHGDKMQLQKRNVVAGVVIISNQSAKLSIKRCRSGNFLLDWKVKPRTGKVVSNQRIFTQLELECAFGLCPESHRNNDGFVARMYGVKFAQKNKYISDGERISLPGACETYSDCVSILLKPEIKQAVVDLIVSKQIGPRFYSPPTQILHYDERQP